MTRTRTAPVYSYRQIWKIAYPILISLIMEQMIGMTDAAFMGRVGEVELGASAIAGVFYMVIFMIGFGFSIGSQIIIARRNGEGNYKETGNVFYHGVCFLLGLAVLMVILTELFSPWLMGRMVSSEEIAGAALSYVKWRLPGLFFAYVTAMFRAFYVGTTQTRTLTLNSVTMVLSNIVFNWIFVFGKFGLPALGIAGAAIGSTLAELVSLIFFIVYTMSKTDCARYGLNRFEGFHFRKLKDILSVSVWTMIQNAVSLSTWLIFFLLIEHLGERSLAVSNIIRNVSGLLWMVLTAFASTCSSLVSLLPSGCHQNIHEHPGSDRSIGAVAVGALLRIPAHGPGKHFLPGGIRNREYAESLSPGTLRPVHLYVVLLFHYARHPRRRGCLLDCGARLRCRYGSPLRRLSPQRQVARQGDISPVPGLSPARPGGIIRGGRISVLSQASCVQGAPNGKN